MAIRKGTINIPNVTGNIIITAIANKISTGDGGTGSCTSIIINEKALNLSAIGQTKQLTTTTVPVNPIEDIVWSSSNTSVAVVNQSGLVTVIGPGSCNITATCGSKTAICPIIVNILIPCTSISIPNTLNIVEEKSVKLIPTITPSNTTDTISWKSSNTQVAVVEEGTITPLVQTGSCTITATCGQQTASCNVTINIKEIVDDALILEDLLLNTTQNVIGGLNKTLVIKARKIPFNAPGTVTWSSSDSNVATVDSNGNVTSKSAGTCTITATCGEYHDTCSLTVNDVSSTQMYDFDLTNNFGNLAITSKAYSRTGFKIYPESDADNCTMYITSKTPAVFCPTASAIRATADMTFVAGRNGHAEITISCSSSTNGAYVRKKYRLFVDIEDTTEDVPILYSNPTITIEGTKAKATQNGVTQYFDVSYTENDGCLGYDSCIALQNDEGVPFYLALTKKGTSPFGRNGLHLSSGGWYTEGSASGSGTYAMQGSMLYFNNFNMTLGVKTINADESFVAKTLEIFNETLPALNVVVDPSSKNTYEFGGIDDNGILGMCWVKSVDEEIHFFINMNTELLTSTHGPCSANNRKWLSTSVHEFGHILGISDQAGHLPSLYHYGRPDDICYYLQPNDIAWVEYLHKEMYGVDLVTTQENIDAQVLSLDLEPPTEEVNIMYFDYLPLNEENTDLIVECNLSYIETKILNSKLELAYDIFEMSNINILKGEVETNQVKILTNAGLEINESGKYKLYLVKNNNSPYSLVNPHEGLIELK